MLTWRVKFFSKKKDRIERAKAAISGLAEKIKPIRIEFQFFEHMDSLKMSFQSEAENLLVFDLESLPGKLSEFVSEIKGLSKSAPWFLAMVEASKVEPLMAYQPHGFLNPFILTEPFGPRLLWHLEASILQLHSVRQDIQASKELAALRSLQEKWQQQASEARFKLELRELAFLQLSLLAETQTVEQVMGQFQKSLLVLQEKIHGREPFEFKVGVFEFLASLNSFSMSWSLPTSKAGQSFQLTAAEAQQDLSELKEVPQALKDMGWPSEASVSFLMKGGLPAFLLISFFGGTDNSPDNLAEGLSDSDWVSQDFFKALVRAFQQKLRDFLSLPNQASALDPVTQLPLQESFYAALDMEMARAQRLGHPLSLVKLHLDHVVELEQALGRVGLQGVIQQVVKIIQGSGRVNDLYFRTEDAELSLILPHCSYKGAAIRAERVRLMVEKHSFLNLGQRITVSQGISSYPQRADSATELDVSASKALDIARSHGGNRICLSSKARGKGAKLFSDRLSSD